MTTTSSIGNLVPQPPHLQDEHQHKNVVFSSQQCHLRTSLGIPAPAPLNLLSLPDEPLGAKYPKIADMIKLAIWDSPQKKLTLRQIYEWVENHYPSLKYRTNKPWERSIRHNLSWKAIFVQVKRPANHPGNGNYWTIDLSQDDGNKRQHKRKERPRGGQKLRKENKSDETSEVNSPYMEDTNPQQPTVSLRTDGDVSCPFNGKMPMPSQMMGYPIFDESRMYNGPYPNMLNAPSGFLPKAEELVLADHRPYPSTDLAHSISTMSIPHFTDTFLDGCGETSRGTRQYGERHYTN